MPTRVALQAYIAAEERLYAYLSQHPEQWERACGEVAQRLTVDQMAAALWMNEYFGMQLDVRNLHKVIEFWDPAGALVAAAGAAKAGPVRVTADEWISAGEFDPNQLIDYLVQYGK